MVNILAGQTSAKILTCPKESPGPSLTAGQAGRQGLFYLLYFHIFYHAGTGIDLKALDGVVLEIPDDESEFIIASGVGNFKFLVKLLVGIDALEKLVPFVVQYLYAEFGAGAVVIHYIE
jgi:hypothetical protein